MSNPEPLTVYQENGYKNRREYLECLAEDNGLPLDVVQSIADVYGPDEDFDALVTACEDAASEGW